MEAVGADHFSEQKIREFLPENLALYSVWMPGSDPAAATITEIYPRMNRADVLTIENDGLALACTIFLIQSGVPLFSDVHKHDAYCDALVAGLKRGLEPQTARDAALADVQHTSGAA